MDRDHFGAALRRAREGRQRTLSELSEATKIPRATLEQLEGGALDALPADVFVRGFIRSYARALVIPDTEALALYERDRTARRALDDQAPAASGLTPPPLAPPALDEDGVPRRGMGLAVFVIILLLIATITLSLLLRRPPQSGEGLSLRVDTGWGSRPSAVDSRRAG